MEQLTKDKKAYLPLVVESLKKIGIHKIILFGSLASDDVHADSDIDLIVVTNDNLFPKSYKEKSDLYLKVSSDETGEQFFSPTAVERLHRTILGHAKPRKIIETPVYEYTEMALQ